MNKILRFAALAPLLALGMEVRATAQEVAVTDVSRRDAAPASGKILLLTNDRVLEGDIERIGDQYRIRRGMGETLIAAARGKRLCADWHEALAYVRGQANLGDPDERLRLARWCQQHGLAEAAAAEAAAAREMRPTHAETKKLVQSLQRSANAAPAVLPLQASKLVEATPQLDVSADSLALFTTKVQPILINACASCHASGKGGSFQLVAPGETAARGATQRNLAMAIQQLRLDNPAASPLVVKAVSAHGTLTQPLFRDRRTVPIQTMQHWAEQLAANNPHLREAQQRERGVSTAARTAPETAATPPSPAPSTTSTAPVAAAVVSRPVTRAEVVQAQAPTITFSNAQGALLAGQSPSPPSPGATLRGILPAASNPSDVYDPAGFNQQKQTAPAN